MTLRIKTLLLISGVLATLLLVVYCALRPLVLREFARVEQAEAVEQMKHAQKALALLGESQASRLKGWGEVYRVMASSNPDVNAWGDDVFDAKSLQVRNDLDLVAVVTANGRVPFERFYNPQQFPLSFPAVLNKHFRKGDALLRERDVVSRGGLLETDRGLFWIFSLPIPPDGGGGTLVLGKQTTLLSLGNEFSNMGQDISVLPLGPLKGQLLSGADASVLQENGTTTVTSWLNDVYGTPIANLQLTSPNTASARGRIALNAFGLLLVGCGLFSLMAAMVPLENLVLAPLAGLNGFIDSVRESGDLSRRISVDGNDEIAHLSTNVNTTFATLQTFNNRLRHSEHLFREMAQTGLGAGDAFFVLSQNSDNLEWHGDIDSLLGYEQGGLPRTWSAWLEHIFLNDKGRVASACSRAFARRELVTVEFKVIRCDGTRRHWMLRGKALIPKGEGESFMRPDGESLKLVGVCIDISERKEVEADLRASRERLELIVETAADAIVITDAEGQISDANKAAEHLFGLTREEICERTFDDSAWKITSVEDIEVPFPHAESPFARVKSLGVPVFDVQYMVRHAEGRQVVVSVNAAPLVDSRGHFAGMVASVSDFTGQHVMKQLLDKQAFSDTLTQLANRARLKDRLQHALMQRGRDEGSVAILFVDLDNFKYIHDSLGHGVGDQILFRIARRLEASLRAGDTAARFGGDEFVILLEQIDGPQYAIAVAKRLLEALREPFPVGSREVFCTPSIGIAFSSPGYNNPEELLRHADAALYEAKRRGKARYEIYQSHLGEGARIRLDTENDLRRALQKHEFSLRYQPKWDLARNQLMGFEALVRWEHPERGIIPPSDFIPIAEETGLIANLGFLVLRDACFQAQKWRHEYGLPLTMAVNVSPLQLRLNEVEGFQKDNGGIVEMVARVLGETGFAPENLILEITESAIVERTGETLQTLNALKDLGVSLAIDDFGTGYSALAYLRDFPFDYLKIDRQFVTNVNETGGNSVIVQSMISLAHALNLKVVAEGIEHAPEATKLKDLGCDMGQGYFFARPLTVSDVETRFGFDVSAAHMQRTPVGQLTSAAPS